MGYLYQMKKRFLMSYQRRHMNHFWFFILLVFIASCDSASAPVDPAATIAESRPSPLPMPDTARQPLSPLASLRPSQPLSPLPPPANAARPSQTDPLTERCRDLSGLLFVTASAPGQQDDWHYQLEYRDGSNTVTLSEAGIRNRFSPDHTYFAYHTPQQNRPDWDTLYINNVTCGPEARLYTLHGDVFRTLPSRAALENLPDKELYEIALYQFEWLPSGGGLVFNTQIVNPAYLNPYLNSGAPTNDLYRFDLATGEITLLFPSGEGGVFELSPHGELIAMRSPNRVRLLSANTFAILNEFTHHQLRDGPEYYKGVGHYSHYPFTWLEDGSGVAVTIPPPEGWYPPSTWEMISDGLLRIWRLGVDGAPAEEIAALDYGYHDPRLLLISPDLQHVIYRAEGKYYGLAHGLPGLRHEPVGSLGRGIQISVMRHLRVADGHDTLLGEWGGLVIHDWLPNRAAFLLSMQDLTPRCTAFSALFCAVEDFLFGAPNPPIHTYTVDLERLPGQDTVSPLSQLGQFIELGDYLSWIDDRRFLYPKRQYPRTEIWLGDLDGEPVKLYDIHGPVYPQSLNANTWLVPKENNPALPPP